MEEPDSNTEFTESENREIDLTESSRNKNSVSVRSDDSLLPVNISNAHTDFVDRKTVAAKYYNKFNFSKLSKRYSDLNVALGITSANKGEGKTLVASNMAVSLSQGYQQRTVLVDMNFRNPELHEIFGVSHRPGLAEAMEKQMLALREILHTLKNEFDFVIADMSSVLPVEEFPVHFINEMDGLVTVLDTQSTRREHLDKMHKHIDENRFVGYIFNKVTEKNK